MGGQVARVADSISCGDHIAEGSADVHANGMPIAHEQKRTTTGHACFPPTILISGWTTTVFVNSAAVAIKDNTMILAHRCGKKWHTGVVNTGSPDVYMEA